MARSVLAIVRLYCLPRLLEARTISLLMRRGECNDRVALLLLSVARRTTSVERAACDALGPK